MTSTGEKLRSLILTDVREKCDKFALFCLTDKCVKASALVSRLLLSLSPFASARASYSAYLTQRREVSQWGFLARPPPASQSQHPGVRASDEPLPFSGQGEQSGIQQNINNRELRKQNWATNNSLERKYYYLHYYFFCNIM